MDNLYTKDELKKFTNTELIDALENTLKIFPTALRVEIEIFRRRNNDYEFVKEEIHDILSAFWILNKLYRDNIIDEFPYNTFKNLKKALIGRLKTNY